MKNTLLNTAVFALILMTSCSEDDLYIGEGELITKEISLENFNEIVVLGSHNVNITQGPIQKVEVTGYSNIIDRIEKHVHNNHWYVDLKKGNYRNSSLTFNIQLPILNKAIIDGSGEIFIDDFKSDESVYLGVIGSGDILATSNTGCKNLMVKIDGSGEIDLIEEFYALEKTHIEIIGTGKFNGYSSQTEICDIDIEGSSVCNVYVTSQLNVKIHGSGTINYIGNPNIESNITGSGKIRDKN